MTSVVHLLQLLPASSDDLCCELCDNSLGAQERSSNTTQQRKKVGVSLVTNFSIPMIICEEAEKLLTSEATGYECFSKT